MAMAQRYSTIKPHIYSFNPSRERPAIADLPTTTFSENSGAGRSNAHLPANIASVRRHCDIHDNEKRN